MELPHVIFPLRLWLQEPQDGAIIVQLMPPKSDLESLRDVLIGSLGLSGVLALSGIFLGLVVGGMLFWARRRSGETPHFRL